MTAIQPAASSSTPGSVSGAAVAQGEGSFASLVSDESPAGASKSKAKPGDADATGLLAGLGLAAIALVAPTPSAGVAAGQAVGADTAALTSNVEADTVASAKLLAGASVTGRSSPAAPDSAAAAKPAATMAAALQAQAEGAVGGEDKADAADSGDASGDPLAAGAKRLAAKGGGEAPAIAAPGVAAPADQAKKGDKTKAAGESPASEIKAAAKADAAPDAAEPAPELVEAKPDAQVRADRPSPTLPTNPAPSGVQPHGGQPAPGLHVGAQLSAGLAAQVAGEIAAHAGSRRTRFEIRLDPAELGRVDVRLDIAHDGRMQTRLLVERPETLDMLKNDQRELARTLEQAGFQLGQGGLAFQLKEGRADLWKASEARSGGTADAETVEEVTPAAYRRAPTTAAGGVDVTV